MIEVAGETGKPGTAGLPILTYHGFGTRRSVTTTDPSWFAETIAALVESGHRAIDLQDWIARGRPDEDRAFALVFDDGLRSLLSVADVVTRYRLPATVFVVAGRVGGVNTWPGQHSRVAGERLLSWSELASLMNLGFQVGAHGVTHTRLDRGAPAIRDLELQCARETIEQRLGRACRLLAYPYGASTPKLRRAAARHYAAAFGTRLDYAGGTQDPYDLARIDTYYLGSRAALDSLIAGRARGWLRWRSALRAVRRRAFGPTGAGLGSIAARRVA